LIFSHFRFTIEAMKKTGNLIFFLNRRCTVGCASCNAGVYTDKGNELSPKWLDKFFNTIHDAAFSGYIIWTGGEPFLSFEGLEKGISLAAHRGFLSEILTSGIWFENHPGYLETLAEKGSFSLRISLDSEHQDRVPMPLIISLIQQALELRIEVNFTLREIPGQPGSVKHFLEEIIEKLPQFYEENVIRSRWLHYIPHMPVAPMDERTSGCGKESRGSGGGNWRGPCKMGFRDIVIGEDGILYPCCGLFGIPGHERLAMGDPLKESWETLEIGSQRAPLFRMLREKGPYGICRELGLEPETWDWPPNESPCHLCHALFHRHADRVYRYYHNS
jgi:organic radical activating enzyme